MTNSTIKMISENQELLSSASWSIFELAQLPKTEETEIAMEEIEGIASYLGGAIGEATENGVFDQFFYHEIATSYAASLTEVITEAENILNNFKNKR